MAEARTEQEIKHTPPDEALIRAFSKRCRSEPRCNSMIAADHIDGLLTDRDRTLRLLEAGKRQTEQIAELKHALDRGDDIDQIEQLIQAL